MVTIENNNRSGQSWVDRATVTQRRCRHDYLIRHPHEADGVRHRLDRLLIALDALAPSTRGRRGQCSKPSLAQRVSDGLNHLTDEALLAVGVIPSYGPQ